MKKDGWRERVEINPEVMGGKPVIKGTRVPVEVIVGSLAGGMTTAEVAREYRVGEEDIKAALPYAALLHNFSRRHSPVFRHGESA